MVVSLPCHSPICTYAEHRSSDCEIDLIKADETRLDEAVNVFGGQDGLVRDVEDTVASHEADVMENQSLQVRVKNLDAADIFSHLFVYVAWNPKDALEVEFVEFVRYSGL